MAESTVQPKRRRLMHGHSGVPEYRVWWDMVARCTDQSHASYYLYGGRGIAVCPEWLADFSAFLAHMGPRPSRVYSLDRIDNGKGYQPGNCRWATMKQQGSNRRNNHHVTFRGQTLTLSEWARHLGIHLNTLSARFLHGWSTEEAMTKPVDAMHSEPRKRRS